MNRRQFWALNLATFVLAALLLGHFFFLRYNGRRSEALASEQAAINHARQLEPILGRLARRIAKGSETEPKLKRILTKYGITVLPETNPDEKPKP